MDETIPLSEPTAAPGTESPSSHGAAETPIKTRNSSDLRSGTESGNGSGSKSLRAGRPTVGYGGDSDVREALNGYKDAARRNPHSVHHITELAEGYAAADLPHKALLQYQRALQAQREHGGEELPDAHLGIGDLCRTFAMSATAVRSYERAVRLRPERPYYRWKLAIALAAMGLFEQAVKQLRTAIELAPRDTYYRFQLADVLLLMGDVPGAVVELQTVVSLAPRDDYYRLRLGAALLCAQRPAEAVPHFERAAALQPGNPAYATLVRYAYACNDQEYGIAVEIDMLELNAYDVDFVVRIQRMCLPLAA